MARIGYLLASIALGATVIAGSALVAGPARAESNGGVRVMPLGDSITDGLTVPGGYRIELWEALVAGGYTVDFVGSMSNGPGNLGDHDHEGHSGWTISQIDANIVSWLTTYTPKTILLHIGTNDMISSASSAPSQLSTLLDHITTTAPNAEVFVATIIPLSFADAAVRTYNAAIPGIVQAQASAGKRVHLVEMYSALTTADLADGVHPNAGGYSKMADVWYEALQSVPDSLNDAGSSASPTTPSSSTPSSSTPPPSSGEPSADPGGCTATYSIVGQWTGGYQGDIKVTAGGSAITAWTVTWTFANGQTIASSWNASITSVGSSVTARNVNHNGGIDAGASTTFGFIGTWNGTNAVPTLDCVAS
ncbi:MAG: SGNH hydrolase [Dactylosporangium sp.]|nr:cellulose binding domain-containing protein [Dactylosporangium sp.]NNJ62656.1 SGNH hydrolase [Dactylosporangium sp.]